MLYRILLFSVKPQHESGIGIHIYPPVWTTFYLPPYPTLLGWYRAPVWVSWAIQQIPIGYLFYIWYVSFHVTHSTQLTLSSPLPMSISLFSMPVFLLTSVQFSSITQSCPTLWDPMNHSMPGLPVHHCLPEFTQTHVHRVGDAFQPSHPLLTPSPPAPNLSQYQSLFQWVNSSHEVAKVLEFQLQHQAFQWTPKTDLL